MVAKGGTLHSVIKTTKAQLFSDFFRAVARLTHISSAIDTFDCYPAVSVVHCLW